MLPFTTEQFFDVFATYNTAIWPVHVLAYALATGLVALVLAGKAWSGRWAAIVLGAFWLWNGLVYHLSFFTAINPAAYAFAAMFVVQGWLFLGYGTARRRLALSFRADGRGLAGMGLIAFAMLGYSALGLVPGHVWPRAPMFGVTPCPTAIFTFGVLLLSARPLPGPLLVIPVVWAVIGTSAALLLGVREDLTLAAATVLALTLLRQRPSSAQDPR